MVILKDENGFIPAGLSSELMRFSAENKNLLTQYGSLYVGTGRTQRVNYGDGVGVYELSGAATEATWIIREFVFTEIGTYYIRNFNYSSSDVVRCYVASFSDPNYTGEFWLEDSNLVFNITTENTTCNFCLYVGEDKVDVSISQTLKIYIGKENKTRWIDCVGSSDNLMNLNFQATTHGVNVVKYNGIVEIPITEELLPPSFSPAILCVGSDGGLSWQKAYPALFVDGLYSIKTTCAGSSETVEECPHAVEGEYTAENQEETIWERMTALGLGR